MRLSMASFAPGWNYELIPDAHAQVREGYQAENKRLEGSRFIVACLTSELDYDGLSDDVELLEGFATSDVAVQFAKGEAEQRILAQLDHTERSQWWRCDGEGSLLRDRFPGPAYQALRCIGDGTGFNKVYIVVGVFEAGAGVAVDGSVIRAIGYNWELASHFTNVAKRKAAGPAA